MLMKILRGWVKFPTGGIVRDLQDRMYPVADPVRLRDQQ